MFHADITSLNPFKPHSYAELMAIRAFREGQLPEAAYEKICKDYEVVDDVLVERVTYRHDGLNITGIIATPLEATPNSTNLIMYNRGGSGNYGALTAHAVMRQFVPLARAGYTVAGSNYRGNDGGEGHDEFGGRDVGNVVALHDIMRSHPLVNEKPCFVIGHSRGGMMTYLLIKNGLPMRAAVAISALSDVYHSGDFSQEMRENVYKRFIPDFEMHEEESLRARSATDWPEQLKIPLLLLHGTKDEAVPHSQSEDLAALLTLHQQPHELILYEGGNHALTRHWPEVIQQIQDWLRRYES